MMPARAQGSTMDQGEARDDTPAFSLLGGPLYRIGIRVGLVRGTNTFGLGIAIAMVLWTVAAGLALTAGVGLFSLAMLGAHVRLLVTIPLLFAAETLVDSRMRAFMAGVFDARLDPGPALARMKDEVVRIAWWRDSRWPELACLVVAVALAWVVPMLQVAGADRTVPAIDPLDVHAPGWWYSIVCLTVLRFLLLRWAWRLLLWFRALWVLSRLPLRLLPVHADGTGGIGGLERVHSHLAVLLLAISSALAASFAVDIAAGTMRLDAVYQAAVAILTLDAIVLVGPLLLFTPQLWAAKMQGLADYMGLAERYASGFDRKWLRGGDAGEPLLGTTDIQSLADLNNAIAVVRGMRIVPMGYAAMANLAIVALLPLAPLALFKYPIQELASQMISRLVGL
jgi:hypothetical protein